MFVERFPIELQKRAKRFARISAAEACQRACKDPTCIPFLWKMINPSEKLHLAIALDMNKLPSNVIERMQPSELAGVVHSLTLQELAYLLTILSVKQLTGVGNQFGFV